ncbi:hypothetical protein LMH87_004919 [Akanthomyces muscarius]|uniref:FAD-binding domain-containing protein n=1 Tax=Akanthomyces muscarius TaxID=2231603 RepID=A0A9W8QLG8_AKAMU|nr:hypothetical protein LMH87_004919 [Akanthomyces muscarius]KAJ4163175.1 hypothetical protein LMH87_004919 [Akanthomyces muscarius]
MSIDDIPLEQLSESHVLILGAGPVGLVLALVLARHGIPSVLLEKNTSITRFPKMDLTLARSMEIFRQLGVPSDEPFNVRFSSGLGSNTPPLSTWSLPSVDEYRKTISAKDDGSMPREPWQRITGDALERLFRAECEASPLVDARYSWLVTDALEDQTGVEVTAQGPNGKPAKIRAGYTVGCEGANSVLRNKLGIILDGGALTHAAHLIHFKSRDLIKLHAQGNFWHTFFPSNPEKHQGSLGGAIIAQDAKEVWTIHDYLTAGADLSEENAQETIMRVLGGMGEAYSIQVDEILAQSTFKPTVALAQTWVGKHQRAILAGDSAHQTVPSGGYGMNMGFIDAWALGWRLAGRIQGWGGPQLLSTYEVERRSVAELKQHWGKTHGMRLMGLSRVVTLDPNVVNASTDEARDLRARIDEYIQKNDDHNQSLGVEMGYRYESSLCVDNPLNKQLPPPQFDHRHYIPTTHPGYRAPHVFLKDGSSIFDSYGVGYTLVAFKDSEGMHSGQQIWFWFDQMDM